MDMNEIMKKAQEMQGKVAAAQEQLARTTINGAAGGGLAAVEMNGKYDTLKLTIAPALMKESPADAAAVILAALKDAKTRVDATIDMVMTAATAGMPLPNAA